MLTKDCIIFLKSKIEGLFLCFPKTYKFFLQKIGRLENEKEALLSLVQKGDIVLDVGANEGYLTQLFSNICGSKGKVHAFEPVLKTYKILNQRITLTFCKNVILNNTALGNKIDEIKIFIPDNDSAQASLKQHQQGSWINRNIKAEICNIITLDHYAEQKGIEKINFLKIDVEGAEFFVLEGGQNIIQSSNPVLYFEICSMWLGEFGVTPYQIIQKVKSYGYDMFYGIWNGIYLFENVEADVEALLTKTSSFNIICGKRSKHQTRFKNLNL
jgi:FkbM family methyltransferase